MPFKWNNFITPTAVIHVYVIAAIMHTQPVHTLAFFTNIPDGTGDLKGSDVFQQREGENGEERQHHQQSTVAKNGAVGEMPCLCDDELYNIVQLKGKRRHRRKHGKLELFKTVTLCVQVVQLTKVPHRRN